MAAGRIVQAGSQRCANAVDPVDFHHNVQCSWILVLYVLLDFTVKGQRDASASTLFSSAVKQKSRFHFKFETMMNKMRLREFSFRVVFFQRQTTSRVVAQSCHPWREAQMLLM